jgi:kanosamine-6-phosphate phosphatase
MIFCKWPKKIDNIIFFDFDETIRPFAIEDRNRTAIKELEIMLQKISSEFNAIFGWISGSNFSSLIEKSNDYISLYPHFIGSSLGSELVFSKNDSYNASIEWEHHIKQSGFRLDLVDDFIRRAGMEGFNLTPQDETYQGRHKRSYYFYEAPSVANHLTAWGLVDCNTESNLSVFVTRCNPAAGDPEGAYDVDLLPSCASKGKQCKFITKLFSIDQRNTIAFGDSANDSEMLNFVAHPYAVANGDLTSITARFKVTNGDYCDGILDTLKRYFYSV